MPDEIQLTPTSYIVLGLLSMFVGEATPYDLKGMASASVGQFWTLPHSQLYAEPARLARAGYLTENQEQSGRRRKLYSLTELGRDALENWLGVLTPEPYVLRDPALLKLFFGAEAHTLAEGQLETHRLKLAEYEALAQHDAGTGPRGPWQALELGIRHERETVRFWSEHSQTTEREPPI
ncbi:MAG TPA: PadR family transcriptional regulator [Solirubrobacteraceae bacterium]|nr:PadR family transcriptional regulator [Solirubrobacteraceae bacterium]